MKGPSIVLKRARMVCFPGAAGATMEALTLFCKVPCEGTEYDMLEFGPVLSEGLTLHFVSTQTIYSENYLN